MLVKDLMRREVFTVQEDDTVGELIDVLVAEHIHGAPVVDRQGKLTGVVTQQDIFFSAMSGDGDGDTPAAPRPELRIRDIMTSPAVCATEETEVTALCDMMFRLRIHRVPVVREGKMVGIVSSLDVCRAVAARRSFSD